MSDISTFLTNYLHDAQKVVILGLGREGKSSYLFLREYLPDLHVTLIDDQPLEDLPSFWSEEVKNHQHTEFVDSDLAQKLNLDDTLVFQSPGIPLNHPLRKTLTRENTVITSNTQLFFEVVRAILPHLKIVGVTGTKGKSTTTSVIYHVLQTGGIPSWLGGNIGIPPLDLVPELSQSDADHGYAVLELSSHQLDLMHSSPDIAVIQNIVPEHLDYYHSFDRYQAAKSHITQFQRPEDCVIFNPSYAASSEVAAESVGHKLTFSAKNVVPAHSDHHLSATVSNGQVWLHREGQNDPVFVLNTDEIALKGKHNLENILPGVVVGNLAHLPVETIAEGLSSFRGLEHRLEHVATVNGIEYYNDSLATVPDATVAALEAFPKQPIILIAGGYDRGVDTDSLARYIANNPVKALVLFPATGPEIAAKIEKMTQVNQETLPIFPIFHVSNMKEAVATATQAADENDIVLLSPAAASFNLFKDYQDRGNQFKDIVRDLPIK